MMMWWFAPDNRLHREPRACSMRKVWPKSMWRGLTCPWRSPHGGRKYVKSCERCLRIDTLEAKSWFDSDNTAQMFSLSFCGCQHHMEKTDLREEMAHCIHKQSNLTGFPDDVIFTQGLCSGFELPEHIPDGDASNECFRDGGHGAGGHSVLIFRLRKYVSPSPHTWPQQTHPLYFVGVVWNVSTLAKSLKMIEQGNSPDY